jgi:hypothetical protein
LVVAGDNVISGPHSSVQTDNSDTPSQRLAGQLYSQGVTGALYNLDGTAGGGYGVTDAGVQSNEILNDGDIAGGVPAGPSLLARVDRDILAEPDVGTVIIDEGLEDVLSADGASATTANLANAYWALQQQLVNFEVGSVMFGTLTPCGGYSDSTDGQQCDAATESGRNDVNDSVTNLPGYCTVDFSAAVAASDGSSPADLVAADDTGDHVNLTLGSSGGYAALASALANGNCALTPPASAPPST